MQANIKDIDVYYTIEEDVRAEIKVKGSRFIASASRASDRESAMDFLRRTRNEFHDATHNCYSYLIGHDGLEFRYSDDGEPSGTAGKPILFEIKKYNYSDIIVVVTRFFGGTKLGVGGLARAYAESAGEALKIAKPRPVYRTVTVRVFCTYEDISVIKKILSEHAVSYMEEYRDAIEIDASVPISKIEFFKNAVVNNTAGRAGALIRE